MPTTPDRLKAELDKKAFGFYWGFCSSSVGQGGQS